MFLGSALPCQVFSVCESSKCLTGFRDGVRGSLSGPVGVRQRNSICPIQRSNEDEIAQSQKTYFGLRSFAVSAAGRRMWGGVTRLCSIVRVGPGRGDAQPLFFGME